MSTNLDTALAAARDGWPVLPCHHPIGGRCSCRRLDCASPGKHPRVQRGLHAATADTQVIRTWWRRWPNANVGVRTGAAPDGAGLVVVDIDPRHDGHTTLAALEAEHGALPATRTAATGGGGQHLFFQHPGSPVPNSAGRIGPGVDVRGDGGYVLIAPSRHITGRSYQWQPAAIAPMPDWLLELARPPRPVTIHPVAPRCRDSWAAAALHAETAAVRTSVEGTRNHMLNRAAFSLGQLVAAGELNELDVIDRLTDAALAAGLGDREIDATITSGLRAGRAHPRHRAG